MRTPRDFERALLTRLLSSKRAANEVLRRNLQDRHFHEPEHAAVFAQVMEHYRKHGEPPGNALVKAYFPGFKPLRNSAKIGALIDELISRQQYVDMAAFQHDLVDALAQVREGKSKASETLATFRSRFDTIAVDNSDRSQALTLREGVRGAWQDYWSAKTEMGITGIPWPWETVNAMTMGMHPEEMISVTARPKCGKTWFLEVVAATCASMGYRVVFKTIEMAKEIVLRRFYAIFASVQYHRWRSGQMSDREESKMLSTLGRIREEDVPVLVIGREPGDNELATLRVHCERFQPDILFIDGAYLIVSRNHEEQRELSGRTKELAQSARIPVVISTQLNRTAGDDKEAKLEHVAFSDAFGQDSDLLISLRRGHEEKARQMVRLDFPGYREGEVEKVYLNWLIATDFSEANMAPDLNTFEGKDESHEEEGTPPAKEKEDKQEDEEA